MKNPDMQSLTRTRAQLAARIPASPLWKIAVEIAERTAESRKTLEHADVLPKDLKDSIEKQIVSVTRPFVPIGRANTRIAPGDLVRLCSVI